MIPYAILSGKISLNDKEPLEIRILELSPDHFRFRLPRRYYALMEKVSAFFLTLSFFDFESYSYETFDFYLKKDAIKRIDGESAFYDLYEVFPDEEAYRILATKLMRQYMTYIRLKTEYPDSYLSEELCGYPADLEEVYYPSFRDQCEEYYSRISEACIDKIGECKEIALMLDRPSLWEAYLSMPFEDFLIYYYKDHYLNPDLLRGIRITHLYLGNDYCGHLFPSMDQLFQIYEKCQEEGLIPVLVLAPVTEDMLAEKTEYLLGLKEKLRTSPGTEELEVVVNDPGMLIWLKNEGLSVIKPVIGNLLHKRRKDPRMSFKKGYEKYHHLLEETAFTDAKFRYFMGGELMYESCGYPFRMEKDSQLMLPYYQINSGGYCTLYAYKNYGDRGHQGTINACEGICESCLFLYPKSLPVVGRYQSLFGYDERILTDFSYLSTYLSGKPKRIILNFL